MRAGAKRKRWHEDQWVIHVRAEVTERDARDELAGVFLRTICCS